MSGGRTGRIGHALQRAAYRRSVCSTLLVSMLWSWVAVAAGGQSPTPEVATSQTTVTMVSPRADVPLFDDVVLEVAVESSTPVVRVDFFVDDRRVGVVAEAPYRLTTNVGTDNRERRLEAIVYGAHGAMGRVTRVAPAVVVDAVMDLDLQQLFVTVTDRRGNRRLDLQADDFEVRDAKRLQEVVTFAGGEIPFSAVLLIDGSYSMAHGPLEAALLGAGHFVRGMAEHDRAKVLVYADQLMGSTPWTERPEELEQALKSVRASGGSAVLDALFLGLELLEAESGRRVMIILSDGWDLHSVLDVDQVHARARRSQAAVYWVRLGIEGSPSGQWDRGPTGWVGHHAGRRNLRRVSLSTWRDDAASQRIFRDLEDIVDLSGGRILDIGHAEEIEAAFRDILQELREQYALGYYPHARLSEDPWRRVRIKLKQRGLTLRTRKGYIDRRGEK